MTRYRFRGRRKANGNHRWVMGDLQMFGDSAWVGSYLVDVDTVCQDTGLCDDRKQPIFEGDIIDFIKDSELCETPCVVRWHPYLTKFYVSFSHGDQPKETDTKASLGDMVFEHGYHIKILGNIYDNPELLPKINPFIIVK